MFRLKPCMVQSSHGSIVHSASLIKLDISFGADSSQRENSRGDGTSQNRFPPRFLAELKSGGPVSGENVRWLWVYHAR